MLLSLLTLNSLHHFKHLTLNNTLSPATESCATLDCRQILLFTWQLSYSLYLSLTHYSFLDVCKATPTRMWQLAQQPYILSVPTLFPCLSLSLVFMHMCVCLRWLEFSNASAHALIAFFSVSVLDSLANILRNILNFTVAPRRRTAIESNTSSFYFCKLHIQNSGSKYFIIQRCRSCLRNICTNLCACWEQIITE